MRKCSLPKQECPSGTKYHSLFCGKKNTTSYKQYKKSAIDRKKEWSIDEKTYNRIKSQNCYLCGNENTTKNYNGIDRINNELGYIPGNIIGCCKTCNIMKKDYSINEFLDKCHQIYKYNKIELFV